MGIIVKDQQAGIHYPFPDKRNIVQHILSLVDAGRSIDIASEGGSDALEPVQQSLAWEILSAVEAHVLKEMGETILVRSFLDCTDVGSKVEFRPRSRFVVVPYVISQAVVKLAFPHCRIIRQLLHLGSGQETMK